jgi:hypothetical protein
MRRNNSDKALTQLAYFIEFPRFGGRTLFPAQEQLQPLPAAHPEAEILPVQ